MPSKIHHRFQIITIICMALSSIACNATLQKQTESDLEESEKSKVIQSNMPYLAAIDLVNVLVQVPRLHPGSQQTIQMIQPESVFGQNLYEVMQIAGYTIDFVNHRDPEAAFLTHSKKLESDHTIYQISLDSFKVKRGYHVVQNRIAPKYSPYVFGADPNKIETDESIFRRFEDG